MIPGVNKVPGIEDVDVSDKDMARVKAVVKSMTPYERENPDEISQSRRRRIAKGCGQDLQAVNQLIKQFNQTRQFMSQMSNGKMSGMNKMMKQLQGQGGLPGGPGNFSASGPMLSPEQIAKQQEAKKLRRMLKKKKKKR